MPLSCQHPGCTKPVAHADACYGRPRGWCEDHTPWSGHYEDCPDWCQRVLRETGTIPPEPRTLAETAQELLHCAKSWAPDARLLGNVRAGDIATLLHAVAATTAHVNARIEAIVSKPDMWGGREDQELQLLLLVEVLGVAQGLTSEDAMERVSKTWRFAKRAMTLPQLRDALLKSLKKGEPPKPEDLKPVKLRPVRWAANGAPAPPPRRRPR